MLRIRPIHARTRDDGDIGRLDPGRALVHLYAGGAVAGTAVMLLPHSGSFNDPLGWVVTAIAWFATVTLQLTWRRLSPRMLELGLAAGIVFVGAAVWSAGSAHGGQAFFYVWAVLYAFYFLPLRRALVMLAAVGLSYTVAVTVLLGQHVDEFMIVMMAVLGVVGPLVTAIKGRVEELVESRARQRTTAILALAHTLDLRDDSTGQHSRSVARYCELMARELGLDEVTVEAVRLAGALHDVGKIGIPDSILLKPGKLTDDEYDLMKRHPQIGAEVVQPLELGEVETWVLLHHERPDGRGYPLGLSDDEIPLEAKILAVADTYEAMTSDRVYRAAPGHDRAVAELQRCAGSQFDPRVVAAFLRAIEEERDSNPATQLATLPSRRDDEAPPLRRVA